MLEEVGEEELQPCSGLEVRAAALQIVEQLADLPRERRGVMGVDRRPGRRADKRGLDEVDVERGSRRAATGEHQHEHAQRSPGAAMLDQVERHERPGLGIRTHRDHALPEGRAHVGVELVDDVDQSDGRAGDGEEEPGLLGDGLAVGPALELLDHPLQTVHLDARSGIAAGDLAVGAVGPEKREKLVGEIVAPGLGGGPSDGGREHHRRTEAEQLGDPAAVEDGADGIPARIPERLVVHDVLTGIDPGEARMVTEQVGVQIDERRGREVSGHGLDSVDGIARHGPRGVGELSVLPGEVDERPPDLHPSLVAKAVWVEGLQLSEQPVPVGDRKAADVADEVAPATRNPSPRPRWRASGPW